MNLADLLGYADILELSKIARNYECDCSSNSKNALIQSILSTLGRRDVFEKQIGGMSIGDLRFLNSLMFDPRNSFSIEELMARARQTGYTKEEQEACNPRETILKFKQRGWIFNGHSPETKHLYRMPDDLKRRFCEVLARQYRIRLITPGEPAGYRDERQLIVDDISFFLEAVHHRELLLSADNGIYKRQLQQILDGMNVREEPVRNTPWRFGYGRMFKEYPNRFSLIYDYCYYNGLIEENGRRLVLTEKGLAAVTGGEKQKLSDVYRFWIRLYKGAVPNLQTLVHWVEMLAKEWVTVDSLGEVLCPLIKPYYYDSPQSIFEQRLLQMMMHLGLVRLGEDERYGKVVQITALGSGVIRGTSVAEDDRIALPEQAPGDRWPRAAD